MKVGPGEGKMSRLLRMYSSLTVTDENIIENCQEISGKALYERTHGKFKAENN